MSLLLVRETDVPGRYYIKYLEQTLYFNVYKCRKEESTLDEELEKVGEFNSKALALIPASAISSFFQIVQGVINYHLYGKTFRVRNKGLLLAMFILGLDQINKVIRELKEEYARSNDYYVVTIEGGCKMGSKKCTPFSVSTIELNREALQILAKNLGAILRKI
ncbi:MAG: hypothetical protein DRO13_02725 [Thermoprotei archaeon]|nr:MAG: hypothetical protein DRO13_02725 [Thermoprotei archaeon]